MKNVLIVANNGMNNSGVPSVISQVVDSQYKECNITLVVFNDENYYYQFLKERNVEIIKIDLKVPNSPIKKLIWYFVSFPRLLEKNISKIIDDKKIDIVHSFKEEEGWPALKAGKKYGVKVRIAHCNNEFKKRNSFFAQLLAKRNCKKLLKYSNCNVAACQKCGELMFKNKPYTIIYNSYNESKFNNKVENVLIDRLVLTQVATFSSRKNQLFAIDVVDHLIKQGNNCVLNLVGFPKEDNYLNEMNKRIKERKLENNIFIIDGQKGIGDMFQKTTFLLLPSVSEAAPIVLVDAQACGIKCFASDTVTKEMDCGGVIFLSITKGCEVWANAIKESFALYKNSRASYDMSRFSKEAFSKSIKDIYKL